VPADDKLLFELVLAGLAGAVAAAAAGAPYNAAAQELMARLIRNGCTEAASSAPL